MAEPARRRSRQTRLGVQNGREADLRAEVLWIGGNAQHRLARCLEQEIVDHGLVLISDLADLGRQCEHHMEVRDG